ncbi:MAG TPA: murein L,D-transpeptidase catalytic domain family protein [Hanamia sp.]|nr:murein L,D-transpeptidase catalytic domain family protein [Hanamia sp.]
MKNTFKKSYLPLSLLFIFLIPFTFISARFKPEEAVKATVAKTTVANSAGGNSVKTFLYDSLQLKDLGLSKQAFIEGVKGYNYLRSQGKLNNDHILSIADFSLPSTQKRLFVIDMENFRLLFNTYVAHGRNSGTEYATQFSNSPESNMSSLGFYITKQPYNGEHGLSLRLEGEEKGINDNAESRAIVIHCADYVSEKTIKVLGYIGRSLGCPALPKKYTKPIIETIKDGSCFFVYSPSQKYLSNSEILQQAS